MKKLFAIALALLVCAALSGCAVEKVAPVSAPAPEVVSPAIEDDGEEVDAQIPDDWDYEDDEELDYGIPRTLTPAPDGTAVDGNPVDYVISDELFSSQMDEIAYYSDEYVGKSFSVIGYVMLSDDPEDENGFAVVRDYQEPIPDEEDEVDAEDGGETMTAEEFAALIASLDESGLEAQVDEAPVDLLETVPPVEMPEPAAASASASWVAAEPASAALSDDPGEPLPELELANEGAASDEDLASDEDVADVDAWDDLDHEHEVYPVGIDCFFEGDVPEADAWVRVVGTLEEYDYYDAEADESFPALRLHAISVTPIPETEGGSRLVTQ